LTAHAESKEWCVGEALRVGRELRENPVYFWTALGADGERDAWAIFQQYDDKD